MSVKHILDVEGTRAPGDDGAYKWRVEDVSSFPTPGFASLHRWCPALAPGALYLLAARPSMGKTSLALNIALINAMECGIRTLFYSLEMPQEALLQRILSMETGIEAIRIQAGPLTRTEQEVVENAANSLRECPLFIDDSSNLCVDQLVAEGVEYSHEKDVGLIVVDYLQLLRGDGDSRRMSREREVSYISQQLKILAKEGNVPVIALSQLNRGVESRVDKRPLSSDLRDSGSLEQDSDVIMFVYREEAYDEDIEYPGLAEIICRKNRTGPVGSSVLYFDKRTTKFYDIYT